MRTRIYMAVILAAIATSVLFGIAITAILSIPGLDERTNSLFPAAIALSLVGGGLFGWWLAPRLRLGRRVGSAGTRTIK